MTPTADKRLNRARMLFFREKYRFDQGNAFLVFVNFALLVATLVNQSGGDRSNTKFYIISGLIATWLLGYVLDRVVRVQDAQERVALKRSPIWQENFQRHDQIEEQIRQLNSKLERLESALISPPLYGNPEFPYGTNEG